MQEGSTSHIGPTALGRHKTVGDRPLDPQRRPIWADGPGLLLLLLSDVHATGKEPFRSWWQSNLADVATDLRDHGGAFQEDRRFGVVLAGDVSFSGLPSEFESVAVELAALFESTLFERNLLVVPGNHDHLRRVLPYDAKGPAKLDPDSMKKAAVHPKHLTDWGMRLQVASEEPYWESAVGSRFFPYERWRRGLQEKGICVAPSSGSFTAGPWKCSVSHPSAGGSWGVEFVGVNSAIASDGSGGSGDDKLWVGNVQTLRCKGGGGARGLQVLLLHHSPADLPEDVDFLEKTLREFHVVIFGHKHIPLCNLDVRPVLIGTPAFCNPAVMAGTKQAEGAFDGYGLVRFGQRELQVFHRRAVSTSTRARRFVSWTGGLDAGSDEFVPAGRIGYDVLGGTCQGGAHERL